MPGGVAPLGHGKRDGARRRQVLAQRGRRKRWEGTEGAKRPEPSGRLTPGKGAGYPFAATNDRVQNLRQQKSFTKTINSVWLYNGFSIEKVI